MLTYLSLQNYKSFKNTVFDFRKGKKSYKKFIAIYGENGSGKSNFVDSLSFLRLSLESFHIVFQMEQILQMKSNSTSPIPLDDILSMMDFQRLLSEQRMIDCDEPTTLEYGFVHNGRSGYYILSFKEGFIGEKLYYFTGKQSGVVFDLSIQNGKISSSFCGNFFKTKDVEKELKSLISQYWGKHSLLSILNRERENKNASYLADSYLSQTFEVIDMILNLTAKHSIGSFQTHDVNVNYPGIINNPLEGKIATNKSKLLDRTECILNNFFTQAYPDIKRIHYSKTSEENALRYKLFVNKMIGGKIRTIGFEHESAGTKRILFMINNLLGAFLRGTIVYDEIDTGIHDLLLKTMLSSMDEWITGQLIVTTHNTYLLETLNPQSVYVINVNHVGDKEVSCLDKYDIHGTNNIRNMYIKGLFGGVPIVDEIEYGEIVDELKKTKAGNGEKK